VNRYDMGKIRKAPNGSVPPSDADRRNLRSHRKRRCFLTDEEVNTHVLVVGTTGSGKSRALWQFLREHRRYGRGFCLIDPGDLAEDFLADIARVMMEREDPDLLKKIHFVELSPYQLARYDPFRFQLPKHVHPELRESFYRSWQHTKVLSFAEIYQWKQGQSANFEGMPRLHRIFVNVFTAISTLIDNRRLSIGDAQILVDVYDPNHHLVYERLRPRLGREIVADFEILHSFKSSRDLRQETESFINRIRSMHGPLLKEMLSGTGKEPVIDLKRIIQRGEFLLVKTARTPYASTDQNAALAAMFIHDVIETVLEMTREERRPFSLFIDEVHKYVRPGIGDIARTARKYKLGLFFATTDLKSLRKGDVDLAPELLSVVNTLIAFRMTWPEDILTISQYLFAQNVDFTELVHEVERRGGPQWFQVNDWSESYSHQSGRGSTSATTVSEGKTSQEASGQSVQRSASLSYRPDGQQTGAARGTSQGETRTASNGTSTSNSTQSGSTENESQGYGVTVNHKMVHIEQAVRERQDTGMLVKSVADQFARFAQMISGQSQRQATVRVRNGKAMQIETAEVRDPFLSADAQARAVEWIKRQLYQVHDYYFTPSLDPEEDERRIREFLSGTDDTEQGVLDAEEKRRFVRGNRPRGLNDRKLNQARSGQTLSPEDDPMP